MGALTVATAALIFAWLTRNDAKRSSALLATAISLQFLLGIATLLSVMALPFASAHQLVALLLLGTIMRFVYLTGTP